MFARVTLFEIDALRIAEAGRLFDETVVPHLRAQPGLRGSW
jgi:hypothetical protein